MTTEHCCFDKTCRSRNRNNGLTLVLIKWNDASYQGGPVYFGDIKPDVIMVTGGILVQETDTHYCTAQDFYEEDSTWRHITNIPKGIVLEVQRFPIVSESSSNKKEVLPILDDNLELPTPIPTSEF